MNSSFFNSPSSPSVWLEAARPKTLPAAIVPVILGTLMASEQVDISLILFICTLLTAISIQITTNFINDLYDFLKGADNEARTGPIRATQAGLVSPKQMKLASFLAIASSIIFGSVLVAEGGFPMLTIGIISLICAVCYTAGPYPLAYLGLGDIFVLVFFGPVATAGTAYLFLDYFSKDTVVAGLALGAISLAILTVNNLRDFETDGLANKKTLVVRFGKTFAKLEYIIALGFAAVVPIYFFLSGTKDLPVLLPIFYLVAAIKPIRNVLKEQDLNTTLASTGKLLVIYGVLFSFGWLLG